MRVVETVKKDAVYYEQLSWLHDNPAFVNEMFEMQGHCVAALTQLDPRDANLNQSTANLLGELTMVNRLIQKFIYKYMKQDENKEME